MIPLLELSWMYKIAECISERQKYCKWKALSKYQFSKFSSARIMCLQIPQNQFLA